MNQYFTLLVAILIAANLIGGGVIWYLRHEEKRTRRHG